MTADDSFLIEYKERIDAGEIIAGRELRKELKNLVEDLKNDEYYYDRKDALLRIDFIENCIRLTKSPFYGKPMELILWQKAFIEALYSFKMQRDLKDRGKVIDRFKKALLMIARKNGKALALDTRIPTPLGDRTMADIKAGDFVFDENGKPVEVLAISEVFKDRPCYEITFEDGERIVCDENHVWTIQTKSCRRVNKYIPRTNRKTWAKNKLNDQAYMNIQTFEMVEDFKRMRRDGKGAEYKYRVPMAAPVEYSKKDLFDPYTLGLWLGDGTRGDNRIITSVDDLPELIEQLTSRGIEIYGIKKYDSRPNVREVRLGENNNNVNDVRDAFRNLDVWMNKHIPEEYFYGSVEQRLELLKGLMDTDGTCAKNGQCEFSQKDERIINGVSRLLSSLGIKHTVNDKYTKCNGKRIHSFVIRFFVDQDFSCFAYKRKHERLKKHLNERMKRKSIIDIRRVENRDTKCIKVNSASGLFLCGERNTVTHNSETLSAIANSEFITGMPGADIVCSSNDDSQASIAYDAIDAMRRLYDPRDVDSKKNQRFILNKVSNTRVWKISEKTQNKEGRNIDFAIQDEAHELKVNNIPKAIEQSQSVKDNPKFLIITTEGFVVDGYLDQELKIARAIINGEDDSISSKRMLPWLYTQDSEQEIFTNPKSWYKSNPSLGTVKKISYLEEQVDLAKKSKADRIYVLSKDFNIKQNAAEAWLNIEDYNYEAKYNLEDLRGSYCLGHVDLAETTDLACAKALILMPDLKTKVIITKYFIPESKLEPDKDDHLAGAHYKEWAKDGWIDISEGNEVDLSRVAEFFYELKKSYNITLYKCGYDQRFAKTWIQAMEEYGWTVKFGELEMVLQNAETLHSATMLVESELKARHINYNENPVDRWCFANTCLQMNNRMQALCVKTEKAKKIDGSVTLVSLFEMFRRYKNDMIRLAGGNK